MNKPIKIIKKLKIDPMLNKSNKYPTCKSGSLNCSETILKKPYKIINKAETTPTLADFFKIKLIRMTKSIIPSNAAS